MRNLAVQLDELGVITIRQGERGGFHFAAIGPGTGDLWTWVAIDAETKLVPPWRVGDRSGETATEFVCDLSRRLANPRTDHKRRAPRLSGSR